MKPTPESLLRFDDATARAVVQRFDLRHLEPAFLDNPYPTYAALRELEPVRRMPDGSLFLTRFADLQAVYRDAKLFSSDKQREFGPKYGTDSLLYAHHTTSLVFNDPPRHTRVRRLIMGALTQRAIAAMEPGLRALVARLLHRIAQQPAPDLIADYASAIPVEIIGNLLGVPHEEREPLREWSLAVLGALEPVLTPAQHDRGNRAIAEMLDYLKGLVVERRRQPGDPNQDVLTRLIQGEVNAEGAVERLDEQELLQNCIFLLNAGHETTTNLIGNALALIGSRPEVRAELLAAIHGPDGGALLLPDAVEEFLRYESSNQLGNRISTAPAEIAGVAIPAGQPVTLCIGAANRDPAQFRDPDRVWLTRQPNRHLAFAFGIHQCAGLSLARLEGRVAIEAFLRRYPKFELADGAVRGGRARFRGWLKLPCTLG